MPKQGEIDYIKNIATEAVQQALGKPFSYEMCGRYLMDIGAILSLLPDWPPARILDLGVGTGWTSIFIAKRGFDVVGQDIAADMIALADQNKALWGVDNVQFVVSDYEAMAFDNEFDAAVFYDSLHHAVDERLALARVYQALKPGGQVITVEPGEGHSQSPGSIEAMRRWGVTEKDMPPHHIMSIGQELGFHDFRVYARYHALQLIYDGGLPPPPPARSRRVARGLRAAYTGLVGPTPPPTPPDPAPPLALRASNILTMRK